jgi:carboxyl-terminal processing protease
MTSRHWKVILAIAGAFAVASVAFSSGLAVGLVIPQLSPGSESSPIELNGPEIADREDSSAPPPGDRQGLMKPFWQAWDILQDEYVDQPLDEKALVQGAIRGMVDSLGDPHTSYMTANEFQQANFPLDGEYEGIGAWVDTDGEYLTIISAMPGSPAERAGCRRQCSNPQRAWAGRHTGDTHHSARGSSRTI